MGALAAWAAWALLASALGGELAAGEPRAEVPKPIDVTVESYNFNTSVRWNYQNRSSKPLFVVEQCCYGSETWIEVSSCVNISQHYCDLTHKIEQCSLFWVRVKALDGLQKSDYTTSEKFTVIRNGKIGPPKLNLSIFDDEILVNIENPLTPYHKKHPLSITANFTDFTYDVFLRKNGSNEKHTFELERCPRRKCSKNLHVPSRDGLYCVSAQGFSFEYDVKGEKSKESCISFPAKHSSESTVLIIVGVLVPIVVVAALVIVFVCLPKKKIKLPKALVSVVRGQVNSNFDIKPDDKYISVVTSSSYKLVSPESEDEKTVEHIDFITEDKTVALNNTGKEVAGDLEDTSSGAVEMNMEEGGVVEVPGGKHDPEDNYSKSIGGQEEMGNNLPTPDLPRSDVQQPQVAKSSRNVGGYDKPHWQDAQPGAEPLVT